MLSVISLFYSAFRSNFMIHHMLSGMRCGVSAVIMSVTWDMASGVLVEKPKHPRPMQATEGSSPSASGTTTTTSDVAHAGGTEKETSGRFHWSSLVIMLAAFVANYILGISTIWIILAVIALGVAVTLSRTKHTPAANAADPHAQMASPTTPATTASDTSDLPDHTTTEEVQK